MILERVATLTFRAVNQPIRTIELIIWRAEDGRWLLTEYNSANNELAFIWRTSDPTYVYEYDRGRYYNRIALFWGPDVTTFKLSCTWNQFQTNPLLYLVEACL